jgi:hypothetical protein
MSTTFYEQTRGLPPELFVFSFILAIPITILWWLIRKFIWKERRKNDV